MNSHRAVLAGLAVLAVLTLSSCVLSAPPQVKDGVLDLRGYDWSKGSVVLSGLWKFGEGWRTVPDAWTGDAAGGPDGRGSGTYRMTLVLDEATPPLALRWGTASTAFQLSESGVVLATVGHPSPVAAEASPAFAPGTVRLPTGRPLELAIFVSNYEYRVGGLWLAPSVGLVPVVEQAQWGEEAAAIALAAGLVLIGLATLILFAYRRSDLTFLFLGGFSLLVALRCLVTGEYTLVKLVPGLSFEVLIRLEYLTAFLPFPAALGFFAAYFPRLAPGWALAAMTWPSIGFGLLALVLPLDLLTRSIQAYYPLVIPALAVATGLGVRRILVERRAFLLLLGVVILSLTGLADMLSAAFFTTTGTFVPWGLGLFVGLQATTLAQNFLRAFSETEALLVQKDLLVREVHHRVKNSLQVVASLVSLQSNRTADPAQKAVFQALRHRITSIALVHEKLYGQGDSGRPDVGEYLTDLLKLQYPRDNLEAGGVQWEVHADPLAADVDYCIDAGLILTELVGNAHKHALLPRRGGRLEVSIRIQGGRLGIEVTDNGPGFPEGFRPEHSGGLGFKLILSLLQRNDGRVVLGPGGKVRVDLKLPSASG